MARILTKREKLILQLTIGVIIFSFVFSFLILPIFNKYDTFNKEIYLAKAKLKKYTWLLNKKGFIETKYNELASKVNFPKESKDSLVTSLSELEALAKDAGVRIIDIRPQGLKNQDLYKEMIIDLKAEGALEGFLKFIYNLENSLSLLRIKRFQLNAKPNTQVLESNLSVSQLLILE